MGCYLSRGSDRYARERIVFVFVWHVVHGRRGLRDAVCEMHQWHEVRDVTEDKFLSFGVAREVRAIDGGSGILRMRL